MRLLIGAPSPEKDSVRIRVSSRLKELASAGLSQNGWEECVHVTPGGVRILTDLDVSRVEAVDIDEALRAHRYSILILGSSKPVLRPFMAAGWSVDCDWSREQNDLGAFHSDTAQIAAALGWATIRAFGHFDDAETSADILAAPSLMQGIIDAADG